MPGFDGTGPAGMGPMTGGGRGLCNPYGARYAGFTGGAGWTMPNAMGYGMPYAMGYNAMGYNAMGYNRFANPWYGGAYGAPYGGYGRGFGGFNAPFGMYGHPYQSFYGFGRGLGPCGMGMAWGRRGGRGRGRW